MKLENTNECSSIDFSKVTFYLFLATTALRHELAAIKIDIIDFIRISYH